MTLAEIANAVDGMVHGDPSVVVDGSVVVDSRLVAVGSLFVALPGERTDGHDHAAAAAAAGASGVLTQRPLPGLPCVVVPDGIVALGRLARAVLDRLPDLVVVGVTGSSGKTSTKDLLAGLLALHGATVAPAGSFNNDIGLPLTVLRAGSETRYLVLEYSARGRGHIARLCRIAPPRAAAVLNVGSAHLGEFGSRQGIAQAKGELVEALPPDGAAVLAADDDLVRAMAGRTRAQVVLAGLADDADVRADDLVLDTGRPRFTLVTAALPVLGTRDARTDAGSAPVALQLVGAHHAANATAAAALALCVGVPLATVARGLSQATPVSAHRMAVADTPGGLTVVDDAYNANPESVRAALAATAELAGDRRCWAVLGPMAELGQAAHEAHREIGRLAAATGYQQVVGVGGPDSDAAVLVAAAAAAGARAQRVDDVDAAVALVRDQAVAGDVVLVKASNSAGLWRVAAQLLEEGPAAQLLEEGPAAQLLEEGPAAQLLEEGPDTPGVPDRGEAGPAGQTGAAPGQRPGTAGEGEATT